VKRILHFLIKNSSLTPGKNRSPQERKFLSFSLEILTNRDTQHVHHFELYFRQTKKNLRTVSQCRSVLAVTLLTYIWEVHGSNLVHDTSCNDWDLSRFSSVPLTESRGSSLKCRSQWPCGLRHELSSAAQTLGSWVRIRLEAWMSMSVLSCV
jgi:hypothetical protein